MKRIALRAHDFHQPVVLFQGDSQLFNGRSRPGSRPGSRGR
jgi:hypothetical protein